MISFNEIETAYIKKIERLIIMKKLVKMFSLQFFILAIAINFAATGQAAEMKLSQEQQIIWGLVESYWESAQN